MRFRNFFLKKLQNKQLVDFGMVSILILLILSIISPSLLYLKICIGLVLINILYPKLYLPFANIWYFLSDFMGNIMSKVILTIVFILLVLPIGIFRKILKKDSLQLKRFKDNSVTSFVTKNHNFISSDLSNPY